MRTVLRNTDEVMHYWANQTQGEGRCGSVSFRGRALYSYRAKIAELIEHDGRLYAVHTNRSWSITTSGHQSDARRASRHLPSISIYDFGHQPFHLKDIVEKDALALLEKAKRSRVRGDSHRALALKRTEDFNKYMEITGCSERIHGVNVDELRESLARSELERQQREEEEQKRQLAAAADGIKRWRAHEQDVCPRTPKPLLRLAFHAGSYIPIVETSWGARIEGQDIYDMWTLVQRARRGDRDYEVGREVGVYRLTKIRRDGSVVVGCHDIDYVEVEGIAKKLGLLKEEVEA